MWEADEANWGDVGVTYDPTDQKVYVFGHGRPSMNVNGTVFLARVPASQATVLVTWTDANVIHAVQVTWQ